MGSTDYSYWFSDHQLGKDGVDLDIELNAKERSQLAHSLDIRSVELATVRFHLQPIDSLKGIHVSGTVDADITQDCVVTLKPVQQRISEAVDVAYLPSEAQKNHPDRVDLDVESDLDIEYYSDGNIDLGRLVTEFIAIGLDPYPRAPGAPQLPFVQKDTDRISSPFEALAVMRDKAKQK